MTKDEIMVILRSSLHRRRHSTPLPTQDDWQMLERRFGCQFPTSFVNFIELLYEHDLPLDVLRVNTVDQDEPQRQAHLGMWEAYEQEIAFNTSGYEWDVTMIPFADLGNGDVLCLRNEEGMPVYGVDHENRQPEKLADTFDVWLTTWDF